MRKWYSEGFQEWHSIFNFLIRTILKENKMLQPQYFYFKYILTWSHTKKLDIVEIINTDLNQKS